MASTSKADQRGSMSRPARLFPKGSPEPLAVSSPARPRYHAFDALRGMAMFLVIGLHAALAYVQEDIKGVLWCVRDTPTWPVFDWFCWWAMGVSNPLYFTIAGFFAVILYDSKGLRGFLSNRGRRVGIPFLAGVVLVLPACMAAWAYGWLVSGRATWRELSRMSFRDPIIQGERLGSGHLWFLEYLLVMLAAYGLIRWAFERRGVSWNGLRRWASMVIASPWRPILLAVPTTFVLWVSREKVGVDAILDRHNSFLIDPVKLLHHASFFLAGIGLYGYRLELARLSWVAPWYLLASIPAFVVRAWLLGLDQGTPLTGWSELGLVGSGALASWLIVFGAIGAAQQVFRGSSPTLSYLADSSYWIYLIHMPILGLIQGDLFLVPGHAFWKMPVVLVLTLAIGFGSYHYLVRHTAIGIGLHGKRKSA